MCLVSICRFLNAPKNSKFEGRDNSNGNPLLHDGNIFFFHENFSIYIQKHSLQFFLMLFTYFQKNECKNLEIQEERQEQWNPTSTAWNFFFLSREFSKIHSETFLTISFLCCFRISRIMNAKKSRNSRGKTRAMETHFYTLQFLFSFTRTFLLTCRAIPYYFSLSPVRISRIMNAKTISKFEREPLRMYNLVLVY